MKPSPESWRGQVLAALLLLILVGVGVRVIWWLIGPLIPMAIVGVFLLAIYGLLLRRR